MLPWQSTEKCTQVHPTWLLRIIRVAADVVDALGYGDPL